MASLTIKNIPEHLYDQLKLVAQNHRRSINSEIIVCLETALLPKKVQAEKRLASAQLLRNQVKATLLTAEDITTAKHEGRA